MKKLMERDEDERAGESVGVQKGEVGYYENMICFHGKEDHQGGLVEGIGVEVPKIESGGLITVGTRGMTGGGMI